MIQSVKFVFLCERKSWAVPPSQYQDTKVSSIGTIILNDIGSVFLLWLY